MAMFMLQSLLLIAIAFIVGAVVGCWLKSMLAPSVAGTGVPTRAAAVGPVAATRSTVGEAAADGARTDAEAQVPEATEATEVGATSSVEAEQPGETADKRPAKGGRSRKPAGKAAAARKKAPVTDDATATGAVPVVKDDLKRISGIGKVIEGKLNAAGVTSFAQIAAWTKKDREAFSKELNFAGRIEREEWVKQAKRLAAAGAAEAPKRSGKGKTAGRKP